MQIYWHNGYRREVWVIGAIQLTDGAADHLHRGLIQPTYYIWLWCKWRDMASARQVVFSHWAAHRDESHSIPLAQSGTDHSEVYKYRVVHFTMDLWRAYTYCVINSGLDDMTVHLGPKIFLKIYHSFMQRMWALISQKCELASPWITTSTKRAVLLRGEWITSPYYELA